MTNTFTSGHKLPNGATVLLSERVRHNLHIVLCYWRHATSESPGGFVTWHCDDEGHCYWGRYPGTDFDKAVVLYNEKLKGYYKTSGLADTAKFERV